MMRSWRPVAVYNCRARRLVDPAQSQYCYLLPTPTIE